MNVEDRDVITLGADVGGKDANAATCEHVLELRELLNQECLGPYSNTIKEFAIVLRIDGSVQSWGQSGINNIVLQKKRGYITADIFMPKEVWSAGNVRYLRKFLGDKVKSAIIEMAERVKQSKIDLSIEELRRDIDRAINKYYFWLHC